MANEKKTSGWKIFFYLTPLYIILGYPLYNWHKKINSGDVNLSKDDYGAFSSDEGEIKKPSFAKSHTPKFNDVGYSVSYNTGGESIRDRETQYIGQKTGYLTYAINKAMKNPKVVKALFDNPLVVKGFMGRDTVKNALKDPAALTNYLKNTNAASNFLNNSVVKAALNNPAVVSALASSKMANTLLSSPAVQGLINDTDKMSELLSSNPELMPLLTNPNVKGALMQNPQTAGALANLNLN